ncbi:hypothetical protein H2203_003633 [Taxawa tesnikishii (nom. ined.)]|nr:hypothetical protein H2203_003633 [Dothideales sp. JES 119]
MSPVVQQLEQAAIGGPYRQRTESTATTQSFPGPPTGPAPGQQQQQQQSAPAPYNPAAPAAPEPIAYREKTPPPVDGATGTGLTAAAMHEHPTQYASAPSHRVSYQQTPQQSYFPGPPQRTASGSFGTAPHTQGISSSFPPPPPGHTKSGSVTVVTTANNHLIPTISELPTANPVCVFPITPDYPYLQSSNPLQSPGLPPTPSHPPAYTTHTPLQSPGFAPSVQSPGLPPPPPGGPQHPQHAQSLGGYSNYSYGQQHQQPPSQQEAYSVHSQAYRPTEAEAAHGAKPPGTKPVQGQGQGQGQGGQGPKPGGLEERLGKVEKGVGRFLKKFDQKW